MKKALLVIDLQNDYFPGGKFPLWNADTVLQNIEQAIQRASANDVPVIHVQHVANLVRQDLPELQRRTSRTRQHEIARPAGHSHLSHP